MCLFLCACSKPAVVVDPFPEELTSGTSRCLFCVSKFDLSDGMFYDYSYGEDPVHITKAYNCPKCGATYVYATNAGYFVAMSPDHYTA